MYMWKTEQEIFAIKNGESDYMGNSSFCAIILLIITDKTDFMQHNRKKVEKYEVFLMLDE